VSSSRLEGHISFFDSRPNVVAFRMTGNHSLLPQSFEITIDRRTVTLRTEVRHNVFQGEFHPIIDLPKYPALPIVQRTIRAPLISIDALGFCVGNARTPAE
jgi:hypothetical protein